jgi:membrane-associated phospholipid phosphatase
MITRVPLRIAVAGLILSLGAAAWPAPARGDDETVEHIGDVLQIALPAAGFLSTFIAGSPDGGLWDRQGSWQSVAGFAASWTTVYAGKAIVAKTRPNGTAQNSFPSGHTMGAFAGASFIDRRYGRTWGIPAYALALFTGYSRVASDWHFADDVVAGASVSILWHAALVTPQPWRASLQPWVGGGTTGVLISVGGAELPDRRTADPETHWRYDFALGPAFLIRNEVTALSDGGTTFDFNDFDKTNDPVTTAGVTLSYETGRNGFDLAYGPFESRDTGTFSEPVRFAGKTFAAGVTTRSSWRLHDIRARWRHRVVDSRWMLDLGLGAMFQSTFVALQAETDTVETSVEDIAALPFIHANLGYRFVDTFWVTFGGDGTVLPEDYMVDVGVNLTWRFHPRWELTGGYQFYARDISTSELTNKIDYNVPFAAFTHLW